MKDHNSFFTATGIPSLFLIFSVLCLAVLSLLTHNRQVYPRRNRKNGSVRELFR